MSEKYRIAIARPSLKSNRLMCLALTMVVCQSARAADVSAPATLQMFEAHWTTIEDRMADIFQAGYGAMWLPPPGRADNGDFSVGYDVYDRFDLGRPRNETLYGTASSLKTLVSKAHQASVNIYTDLILNHAGFSDLSTVDDQGTPSETDDVTFAESGGYPGLAITLPNDIDGDFHSSFESGDLNGRLSNLVDIAQEKSYQFIRHPIGANPDNIPAGTTPAFGRLANAPDPNNARFYPDQALGATQLDVDPDPNNEFFITRYDFNTATPLDGDPVLETAEQLTLRHAQWMVQEIGVDGFRIDAAKHFPQNTLVLLDQYLHRASFQRNHDGSIKPTFSFSEVLDGNKEFVQGFINKGLPNPAAIDQADFEVKGNRDALDFSLFFALRQNLSGNGFQNNWHQIRDASQDTQDDGFRNGSQGVSFVDSHDNLAGGFPFLKNVAYAYMLMLPGNANVYFNAKEFGDVREFPNDGKVDALGGVFGDTVTTLVNLRNTHGRGNFHERWIDEAFGDTSGNGEQESNIYVFERDNSVIVGLNSRLDAGFDERTPVATGFQAGTVLVELTGNAADLTVDPNGDIPEAIRVMPSGRPDGTGDITIRIPRNDGHGRGYVIYGLAGPQGTLSLTNVASIIAGASPTEETNGTARLSDIQVITADSFEVGFNTAPVTLPAPFGETEPSRDFAADGDNALLRIDQGVDLNGNPGIDYVVPGSVVYGFEEFTETRTPGYIDDGNGDNVGTGSGDYAQTVDATQLSEGRHFLTVRAFRHRESGEPAIYTDFRRTIYIDRSPPDSSVDSFEPFATNPTALEDRDLIVSNPDDTADNMHFFLDLPAEITDAEILQRVNNGEGDADQYDRNSFIFGYFGVTTGNHVATVVTFEKTGNFSIQRFTGLFTSTGIGAGFGDMDFDGAFEATDLLGQNNGSVEDVLYSQNNQFNAAFDVNGDGLGDNRDLFALDNELSSGGADASTLIAYNELLLKRGDLDDSGSAGPEDFDQLYNNFGSSDWLLDLNVDEIVSILDVQAFVTGILRTAPGDFDLNGIVDEDDLAIWQANEGLASNARYTQGDADFDGDVDEADRLIWLSNEHSVAPLAIIKADFNDDGIVDSGDYARWLSTLGSSANLSADANGDGIVDAGDYAFWRQLYGRSLFSMPQSSTATSKDGTQVPEPASAVSMCLVFSVPFVTSRVGSVLPNFIRGGDQND